jgi:hypothetical protein
MWTPVHPSPSVRRSRPPGVLLIAGVACVGLAAPAPASAGTQRVTENVALKLVKKTGSSFRHRGSVTGTVPGSATSSTTLKGLTLSGTVSIRTKHGTLRIRIRGTARSNDLRSKFDGSARMAGGTGRYKRARGSGRFTGVVNRRTWAATIKATGSLTT